MLSGHSFNALLKTLEEPPEHVKFLLATTDPQKLPVTVLSRCLKFNLKRLSVTQISQQLEIILQQEQLEFEATALKPIAIAADGSMRDALSLLDQAIAFGAGTISCSNVQTMLGNASGGQIVGLIDTLIRQDGNAMVRQLRDILASGMGTDSVLSEMINMLQQLALCQMVPEAIDDSHHDGEILQRLAKDISPEDSQLYYQIALSGRQDLELSPFPHGALEMILLRMLAFRPVTNRIETTEEQMPVPAKKKTLNTDIKEPSLANNKSSEVPAPIKDVVATPTVNPQKHLETPLSQTGNTNSPANVKTANISSSQPSDGPPQQDLPPLDAYYSDQAYQHEELEQEQDSALSFKPTVDKQSVKTEKKTDEQVLLKTQTPESTASKNSDVSDIQALPKEKSLATQQQESSLSTTETKEAQAREILDVNDSENHTRLWHKLVKEIECNGLEREIFMHSSLLHKLKENDKLALKFGLDRAHKELLDDKIYKRLKLKLDDYFQTEVKLDYVELSSEQQEQFISPKNQELKNAQERLHNARQSFINDPEINLLVNSFDGKIIQESIKPI